MSDDLTLWSATKLEGAIRNRSVSSLELLAAFAEKIEKLDQQVNAVVTWPHGCHAAASSPRRTGRLPR